MHDRIDIYRLAAEAGVDWRTARKFLDGSHRLKPMTVARLRRVAEALGIEVPPPSEVPAVP